MTGLLTQFMDRCAVPMDQFTLVAGSRVYPGREDRRKLYRNAVGWDLFSGEGVDQVVDLEKYDGPDRFGHIDCVSVLEHSKYPWLVAATLERLLTENGTILVTVPFVWRVHSYPSDYWRMTAEAIPVLFRNISWDVIQYANTKLTDSVRGERVSEFPFFPRTEVYAFGRRR